MRVVIVTADDEASGWLRVILTAAGLSVVEVPEATSDHPELKLADLLVADADAARVLGSEGPVRRILLVSRGGAVDMGALVTGGYSDVLAIPSPEDEILVKVGRALDRLLQRAKSATTLRGKDLRDIVAQAVRAIQAVPRTDALRVAEDRLSVLMLLVDGHESGEGGTPSHSTRVASLARLVCQHLKIGQPDAGWLVLAARLHDTGLVAMRLRLDQPAPLTEDLRRSLSSHPALSAEICDPLRAFGLPVDAIRHHHEHPDGTGYPVGFTDVPRDAQIIGAVDMYEALTSARPWRMALSETDALQALSGFDAAIVDAVRKSVG